MPGGPGGAGGGAPADTEKFYELLGVPPGAGAQEIKKAYKKLAVTHPGGDPEKSKEIARAFEVLSDPEKRARYDQFGEAGLGGDAGGKKAGGGKKGGGAAAGGKKGGGAAGGKGGTGTSPPELADFLKKGGKKG